MEKRLDEFNNEILWEIPVKPFTLFLTVNYLGTHKKVSIPFFNARLCKIKRKVVGTRITLQLRAFSEVAHQIAISCMLGVSENIKITLDCLWNNKKHKVKIKTLFWWQGHHSVDFGRTIVDTIFVIESYYLRYLVR